MNKNDLIISMICILVGAGSILGVVFYPLYVLPLIVGISIFILIFQKLNVKNEKNIIMKKKDLIALVIVILIFVGILIGGIIFEPLLTIGFVGVISTFINNYQLMQYLERKFERRKS